MPMNPDKYPTFWKKLSAHIRFVRAGNRCEWCGVENGAIGTRDDSGKFWTEHQVHNMNSDRGRELFGDFPKMIRIVLTVAHIDHDTTNNRFSNLAALCQKCHLTHDAKYHAQNAAKTRRRKYEQTTGQMRMF